MVDALNIQDLTVAIPGQPPLLDRIGFRLTQGERVGLVGPSGCGKSLTAAALTGLLRPPLAITGGQIEVNGRRIDHDRPKSWRKLRGPTVFQIFQSPGTALTPARRVGPQLAEAAQIAHAPKSAVAAALDTVALAPRVAKLYPYQLSGGMKQRVLIAMALILRPKVLIADEPTTGLDVLTEREVLRALNRMADDTGAALVFISHDLRAVAEVSTRALVMDNGQLVEDAPIAELATSSAAPARALAKAALVLKTAC